MSPGAARTPTPGQGKEETDFRVRQERILPGGTWYGADPSRNSVPWDDTSSTTSATDSTVKPLTAVEGKVAAIVGSRGPCAKGHRKTGPLVQEPSPSNGPTRLGTRERHSAPCYLSRLFLLWHSGTFINPLQLWAACRVSETCHWRLTAQA